MNDPRPRFLDPTLGHLASALELRRKPPRPTVLVVDDEPMIRELLALGLLSYGFEVKTAAGGHEAVATCKIEVPKSMSETYVSIDLSWSSLVLPLSVMPTSVWYSWRMCSL